MQQTNYIKVFFPLIQYFFFNLCGGNNHFVCIKRGRFRDQLSAVSLNRSIYLVNCKLLFL